MEKVTIRRATPQDKEAVCKIHSNVYEGRDYLPAYYDHFLSSPAMYPAVLLYEGQITAFGVGHIIDNGETIITRAGRTGPKFERRGFTTQINMYLVDWARSKGAGTMVFITSDSNPSLNKESYRSKTKYIMTQQFPTYYFAGQGLTFSEKDQHSTSLLRGISSKHLSLYFKSKTTRDYLAPEGRLIVDAVPYKLLDANIPFMLQPKEFTVAYSDIKEEHGQWTGLLSFGLVFPVPKPQYKYVLNIFGTDTSSVRLHIIKHLIRLKEKTKGVTAMLVYVPEKFDLNCIDVVFEEFGIARKPHHSVYPGLKSSQIYAYEYIDQRQSKL